MNVVRSLVGNRNIHEWKEKKKTTRTAPSRVPRHVRNASVDEISQRNSSELTMSRLARMLRLPETPFPANGNHSVSRVSTCGCLTSWNTIPGTEPLTLPSPNFEIADPRRTRATWSSKTERVGLFADTELFSNPSMTSRDLGRERPRTRIGRSSPPVNGKRAPLVLMLLARKRLFQKRPGP